MTKLLILSPAFFVLAIVAALLDFTGILLAEVAQALFVCFLVLLVISAVVVAIKSADWCD